MECEIMSKKSEIEAFLAEAAEQAPERAEAVFPVREKIRPNLIPCIKASSLKATTKALKASMVFPPPSI